MGLTFGFRVFEFYFESLILNFGFVAKFSTFIQCVMVDALIFQDIGGAPFASHLQTKWNKDSSIPMYKWLSECQTKEDKQRLHMLGNCVVPAAASLAMAVLLKMKRDDCIDS